MDVSKYPHIAITEDGRLCYMGQHHPGFLLVLYDTLLHLGDNGDVLIYHARMSMARSMEQCRGQRNNSYSTRGTVVSNRHGCGARQHRQ
jgi:hypothetical protein